MLQKTFLNWEEVNTLWENTHYLWEDVAIFVRIGNIVGGSGGYSEYVKGNPWNKLRRDIGEEKTKRVIKLYCKFKDIEYEKAVEINNDIKVTATDFELFVKEGISIKVNI